MCKAEHRNDALLVNCCNMSIQSLALKITSGHLLWCTLHQSCMHFCLPALLPSLIHSCLYALIAPLCVMDFCVCILQGCLQTACTKSRQWPCRCVAADFGKNGIGQMGITHMLEALKNNETLETLVLDTNSIGDDGAEAVAQYMAGGMQHAHDYQNSTNPGETRLARHIPKLILSQKAQTTLLLLTQNTSIHRMPAQVSTLTLAKQRTGTTLACTWVVVLSGHRICAGL